MKWNENWQSATRIAKIELNTMFYSPVAWLILVVFAFQVGLAYSGLLNGLIHQQALGAAASGITGELFGKVSYFGGPMKDNFFTSIITYLYLYLPLMTMGLLSREYSSGSVKLLFSVPIPNRSIVLGKFGAMLVYGGMMTGIVLLYVGYSACVVEHFDWGQAWCGVLGIFLLICTYSAIGLFMSSITGYPVVAAIGTLALLAVLNYIGGVGQDIGFVRDVTYWLALSDKTKSFVLGIIPTESVIYFLTLIVFFLYLTLLKLGDLRTRRSRKRMYFRYALAVALLLGVSWVSSRPSCKFYADLTATQSNTLSEESRGVVKQLEGPLKITTYVNMLDVYMWSLLLPVKIQEDKARFEQYRRFKPEIEMEYVYYWDEAENTSLKEKYPDLTNEERAKLICMTNNVDFELLLSPEEIRKEIDLSPFGNRAVRLLERGNGERAFLPLYTGHEPHPREAAITAVLKHLVGETMTVAFVEGHSDHSIMNPEGRGYWWITSNFFHLGSLRSMGFEVGGLNLVKEDIPEEVDILVVSSLKKPLTEEEQQKIQHYIDAGGNLMVMTEAGCQQNTEAIVAGLGIRFSDETAVCLSQNPTVIMAEMAKEAVAGIPDVAGIVNDQTIVVQEEVPAIDYSGVTGFRVLPVVVSKPQGVWLEKEGMGDGEEAVVYHPEAGEQEGVYPFMVAMEKEVNGKTQRIVVASSAGWFSNEYRRWMTSPVYANDRLVPLLMRWLAEEEFPVAAKRDSPGDNRIRLGSRDRKYNTGVMMGVIPALILGAGMIMIRRRKRI